MLTSRYSVELIKQGNAHLYKTKKGGDEDLFKSVTFYLGVVAKPALVPWAKNLALEQVAQELLALGATPFLAEPEAVKDLIDRAKKRPEVVLNEAADLGSRAHAHFDRVLKGEPLGDIPKDLENPVLAFNDWFKSSGIEIIQGDTPVASWRHKYGGSFDFIYKKDGHYGVGDFKSSNGIYSSMALQVGAYCEAASEQFGVPFDLGMIVRFGKTTPDYEVRTLDVPECSQAFLQAKLLKDTLDRIDKQWKPKKKE